MVSESWRSIVRKDITHLVRNVRRKNSLGIPTEQKNVEDELNHSGGLPP